MRCKIAVWKEANKSVRQTQHLFNVEFVINLAPTRRTIYAIHRKFMKTGSVVDAQRSRYVLQQNWRSADHLFIQRILRLKDIKAFPYKLLTVHKLEEDNDRRVEMCETLLNH